jgi:phenylpyruvate tautomerase PptA (4-oxalocrotonate tautomerase family)
MPLYTAISQEGFLSDKTKTTIAQQITRIHSTIMKVPREFVRVVFLSYPQGSGFAAGNQTPIVCLNCVLRSGHTAEEKAEILEQLWSIFQKLTGVATDQLALSLQEIPSENAMELGQIMRPVGQRQTSSSEDKPGAE